MFRAGFVLLLVLLSLRSLIPSFIYEKPELMVSFKVKTESGKIVYEKYKEGKRKGQFVRDINHKKVPIFARNKNGNCIPEWVQVKGKKAVKKIVMEPVTDKDGTILKDKKGKVRKKKALMTDTVFERCYLPWWYKKFFPFKKKVKRGLDLQGGTHLVLRVDVEKAILNKAARLSEDLVSFLKEKKLITDKKKVFANPYKPQVEVTILDSKKARVFRDLVEKEWQYLKTTSTSKTGVYFVKYKDDYVQKSKAAAVAQAIETIRNRVDSLGVSEPSISKYGVTEIVVQLPGLKDPRRAKEIIGKTALLAFHVVEDDAAISSTIFSDMDKDKKKTKGVQKVVSSYSRPDGRGQGVDRFFWHNNKTVLQRWANTWNRKLAQGYDRKYKLLLGKYERSTNDKDKRSMPWRTYLLWRTASLTGEELEEARPQIDPQMNRPEVGLNFTRKGGELFEKMTGAHIGHRFAIVLEGKVDSAPVIQDRIGGGRARITLGGFLKSYEEIMQDAKDLSFVLKSGSLPAPVDILYEKTIGPGLGKDSINRGRNSLMIGFMLVIIFILLYYKLSGLNANLALFLNIFFVMAMMASFGATLTLPGMAGILLTIGMAVDANILIFERIREELRDEKSVRVAIQNGYEKAFITILDANITTAIAGMVLYQYGSGPIRGFAVTLLIGIICSVFTALFVTRLVYGIVIGTKNPQTLSI